MIIKERSPVVIGLKQQKYPASIRKDSVNPDLSFKNNADQTGTNEIQIKKDEIIPGSVKGIAKSERSYRNREKNKTEKINPAETTDPDESHG